MSYRLILTLALAVCAGRAQSVSVKWEELTGPDFVKALEQAKATCLLPFGIVEKHGPAGPLGTDLINVRYASLNAAKQEYALVFPEYYFGQIFEAKHQPGTIAYSDHLQFELLQETTAEMARNGCKKIIIVNGHGGNNALLQYFVHVQIEHAKGYVVYSFSNTGGPEPTGAAAPSRPGVDGHAGEGELSNVMASRPDLVHPERASSESGADQKRLDLPPGMSTGITWYSRFPNHYQGDAAGANAARGEASMKVLIGRIANAIRAAKADENSLKLQNEFQERATHPLDTKQ
ncbi:MAG: creatininase [Terriglobia bacterium]|nr:MAG: creatininase [Terriglobia bacterium]